MLCIRNDPFDNLGIARAALAAVGVAAQPLDGFGTKTAWPSLDEIGGLIVFGGEMNVDEIEAHPYLLRERQLMADAVRRGLPVLGICLGAQMLARALGAAVHPSPVRELGFKPVRLTEAGASDPLLANFGRSACVFEWHEDTFDLPAGAELLATGEAGMNLAFRYGERAWGVQFHFEVNRDGIDAWLKAAGPTVEMVWNRTAEEVRQEVDQRLENQVRQARGAFAVFGRIVSQG